VRYLFVSVQIKSAEAVVTEQPVQFRRMECQMVVCMTERRDLYWDGRNRHLRSATPAFQLRRLIKSLSRSCIISNQPPAGRMGGNWKDGNRVGARFCSAHGQTDVYEQFPGRGRLAAASNDWRFCRSKIDTRTARDLFWFRLCRPLRVEGRATGKRN